MRMNVKISLVIGIFCLCITGAIVVIGYLWQQSLYNTNAGEVLGSTIFVSSSETGYFEENTYDEVKATVSTAELDSFYIQSFSQNLPLVIFAVCGILLVSTFILWLILKRIQLKQTISIIEELKVMNGDSTMKNIDKGIQGALNALKEKYAANLEDYKRLSSYMTHDQKNTIAVLKSNLEQEEYFQGNLRLVDRLTDSVDDILTLAENEEDEMSIIDVSLIGAEICDTYRKFYPKLTFSFSENENLEVLGKERWLYRAISNLVDNAVKYGENKEVHVSITAQKNSVIIKIEDQGCGLDKEMQQQIFEHKYRVNELKKDGHGIGLSVVKHVCTLCKGNIYVESVKNKGSVFYLSFPTASNEQEEKPTAVEYGQLILQ